MSKQIIDYKEEIVTQLDTLPKEKIKEVIDFIGYLKNKSDKKSRWNALCEWGKKFAKEKGLKEKDIITSVMKGRYKIGKDNSSS